LGPVQGLDHDLQAAAEEHLVRALHADLERVPDGHVAVGVGHEVVGLEDSLVDKPIQVELVVIVEPVGSQN